MPKPNFRVVDNEHPHTRDIARKAVKKFRTLVEQEKLPISNQICTGAPNLFVDEVISKTQRDIPEVDGPRYRVNPLLALFLVVGSVVGLVLLVNSMR